MKTTQYTKRDNVIALTILPVYYLFLNYMLFGTAYFTRLHVFALATVSIVLIWTPIYFLHALPALYFRRRLPAVRRIWLRLALVVPVHMAMSSLAIVGLFYGYAWLGFPYFTFNGVHLYNILLINVFFNLLINGVHESVYTFERWSQTLSETEKLKQANLQSRLEGLKHQINPHFLFNSLNSLSSLIDEDPERAERFIEELASVYRYLLQTNEHELVTLSNELRFIQSYYHLQRTRYGSGLTLEVDVADEYLEAQLPPLTLQLLVENAIKHNVVAADQPLQISIRTTTVPKAGAGESYQPGRLHVSNTLQRRPARVLSNGVGLVNIATKYKLLGQAPMEIDERDGSFTVTLPLLTAWSALDA